MVVISKASATVDNHNVLDCRSLRLL